MRPYVGADDQPKTSVTLLISKDKGDLQDNVLKDNSAGDEEHSLLNPARLHCPKLGFSECLNELTVVKDFHTFLLY